MAAPVNVKLEVPTDEPINWEKQKEEWSLLNKAVFGNSDFFPLQNFFHK